MLKICAKMVPRLLNVDQKERRMQVCQDIIELSVFKLNQICFVESWIFEYDPETKRQRCQWKSPTSTRPKKARQSKSKVKVMLITFRLQPPPSVTPTPLRKKKRESMSEAASSTVSQFLPQGETINQQVYKEIPAAAFASLSARLRRDETSCGRTNRGCFTTTMHLLTTPP